MTDTWDTEAEALFWRLFPEARGEWADVRDDTKELLRSLVAKGTP